MFKKGVTALAGLIIVFMAGAGAVGASPQQVIVEAGDTLWKLSRQFNTTVTVLAEENNLENPDVIEEGQKLVLPVSAGNSSEKTHTVEAGETLWQIARQYNVPAAAIFVASEMVNPHVVYEGKKLTIPGEHAPGWELSLNDLDVFARLVYSEASGEPYTGQVAVAASVLNRVESNTYPDTLTGVIFQVVNGHYQYSPVRDGRIWLTPDDTSYQAVWDALRGWDPSYGATGFYNPAKTANVWVRNQPVTTVINNHIFFR